MKEISRVTDYTSDYLASVTQVIEQLNIASIEKIFDLLVRTRTECGRLFILGVGGNAANASHAVNDFRKLAGIEAYAPTDNVSEMTARVNDEGWTAVFEAWLRTSHLQSGDTVLVFSVGGGNIEKNISPNLVVALQYARQCGAQIAGIVDRDGGDTAQMADICVLIPPVAPQAITPQNESFQALIWHLIVTHPRLKLVEDKWESIR
jgi:D-sedoheptulose 7-phosphate isomerase